MAREKHHHELAVAVQGPLRFDRRDPSKTRGTSLLLLTLGGLAAVWVPQQPSAPLVMTPGQVALQSPAVGVAGPAQAITISNPGVASAALGTFAVSDPARFSVDLAQCSGGVVLPGQQCVLLVRFQPTSVAGATDALTHTQSVGTVVLEGRVASSSPSPGPPPTPTPTAPPRATPPPARPVASAPRATIRPQALDYGTVEVLATALQPVALANAGSVPVSGVTWRVEGADRRDFRLADAGCADDLAPGSTCQVEIEFSPSSMGERRAVLVARSGDRELDRVPVVGAGTRRPHPRAELTPNPVSFTNRAKDASVVVTNLGDAPLRVSRVTVDNSKAFEVRNRECEKLATLGPGQSCEVKVRFRGKTAATGLLTVAHDDEASPTGVALAAEMTKGEMRPWLKRLIIAGAVAGTAAGIAAIAAGDEPSSPPDRGTEGGHDSDTPVVRTPVPYVTPQPSPSPAPAPAPTPRPTPTPPPTPPETRTARPR